MLFVRQRLMTPTVAMNGPTDELRSYVWPGDLVLLPLDTNHCRATVDHIEFNCCGTAHVDYAARAMGPAINNPHDDGPSVAEVCDQNHGAERQRAMSSGKPS